MSGHKPSKPVLADLSKMIESIAKGNPFDFKKSIHAIEKAVIEFTLERTRYNQAAAAEFLGLIEQTLRYKMRMNGIPSHRKTGFPMSKRKRNR